jgi:hypothetical protein
MSKSTVLFSLVLAVTVASFNVTFVIHFVSAIQHALILAQ